MARSMACLPLVSTRKFVPSRAWTTSSTLLTPKEAPKITDFNNCREYLLYKFANKKKLTNTEWTSTLEDITGTLPMSDINSLIDDKVPDYEELSMGKKRHTVMRTNKLAHQQLNEESRTLFVLSVCGEMKNLSLALSFQDFLRESMEQDLSIKQKQVILRLISKTEDNDKEVIAKSIQTCDELKKNRLPKEKSNSNLSFQLLGAYANTSSWRQAFEVCDLSRDMSFSQSGPHLVSVAPVTILIRRLLKEGEFEKMWRLMRSSLFLAYGEALRETIPDEIDKVAVDWLNFCQSVKTDKDCFENVEKLLTYFSDIGYFLRCDVEEKLKEIFHGRLKNEYELKDFKISQKGVCPVCKTHLERLKISKDVVEKLRNSVDSRLVRGKDMYWQTTPKELNK